MGSLIISLLTLILIFISGFVILLVLMQRTSQSGGMGAALGGGAAESAFGSETNNVLTRATIYCTIAFFVVSLGLFLFYQSRAAERNQNFNPEILISSPESDSPESTNNLSESTAIPVEMPAESNFSADVADAETMVEDAIEVPE